MLYIIGVAHRAQSRKPNCDKTEAQQALTQCLRRAIEENHPVFVGEEHNEEFLARSGEVSIAKEVAEEYKVEFRFCDPNHQQRDAIGYRSLQSIWLQLSLEEPGLSQDELDLKARSIEIARYFPIREQFWVKRLEGCRDANAVFVCGDVHIQGFEKLLRTEGISYTVVQRGIGVTEGDALYYRALEYSAEHPKLFDK